MCTGGQHLQRPEKGVGSPELEVTCDHDQPDVGAGTQARAL